MTGSFDKKAAEYVSAAFSFVAILCKIVNQM
jgi:hypothetical protein